MVVVPLVGLGVIGYLLGTIPRIEGAPTPTAPPGSASGVTSVSATMSNLLPSISPALAWPAGGVYVGEGISPVLASLAEKICWGEPIDMGELLPESKRTRQQGRPDLAGPTNLHMAPEFCLICGSEGVRGTGAGAGTDGVPGYHRTLWG